VGGPDELGSAGGGVARPRRKQKRSDLATPERWLDQAIDAPSAAQALR